MTTTAATKGREFEIRAGFATAWVRVWPAEGGGVWFRMGEALGMADSLGDALMDARALLEMQNEAFREVVG